MADNSSSSNESSSSDYSTDSSDEDGMETAQINGIKVQLPQGLCEREDIFKEFFSVDLWNSLTDQNKQHLQTFLPNYPENDDLEKAKTLQRLFDFDTFKFSNPLIECHKYLKAGYFRPDIAKMRRIIHKTEKKEAKYRYRSFREQLKHEVIESQEKLLNQVRNLPPRFEPKQEKRKLSVDYVSHRTKKRYFQILSSVRSKTEDTDCSSDENYPEGPPPPLSRKQKRHLNSIRNNLNNSKEKMFGSTMVAKLNGFSIELEKYITPHHNPFYVNDESYKNMLYQHKKRKFENPADPDLHVKGITMTEVVNRTQLPYFKSVPIKINPPETKSKKRLKRDHTTSRKSPEVNIHKFNSHLFGHSSNSDSDSDSIIDAVTVTNSKKNKSHKVSKPAPRVPTPKLIQEIKKEPMTEPVKSIMNSSSSPIPGSFDTSLVKTESPNVTPIKVEHIDNIDIMNTPIDLESTEIDIMDFTVKPELMQDTHANFFSLIRDVICSTNEHRMNMYMLQERLKAWQENPISPLNDWYSYTDNWISILPSAITFLCGNASDQPDDFVPYMEYKVALDVYQWIGAGRDSDQLLSTLCTFWLEHRTESKLTSPNEIEVDVTDRDSTPPPPRFPTNWTVRKASPEEIKDYREQERRRYDNPHKSFTYRCNGYESVVGPLKGMYNPAVGNAKARGHTMLNADRPNFVTILSLVRDATARLPNGEGTRADICELLKSSQYISSTAPDSILQSVVSGALDRMHTQWDPCVRYEQKKKIWIYLHRHRTEEDFERIHQQYQGVQRTKKPPSKKSPPKPKTPKTDKNVKALKLDLAAQQQPIASQLQELTPSKAKSVRKSVLQTQEQKIIPEDKPIPISPPNLVPTTAPKSTSLLLSNNLPKSAEQKAPMTLLLKEELDISEPRVESPTVRTAKNQMVKILSPSQGKSLIIPTSNPQIIKQIQERSAPSKHISQVVTQQLLQTIAAQQKQLLVQKNSGEGLSIPDNKPEKLKLAANIQQQIVGITPQQLQNIKNVTLLRPNASQTQNISLTPISSISQNIDSSTPQNIVTVAVSKQTSLNDEISPGVQIKTHGNLTPAQQQQILQTIKQKILPNASVLTNQQQIILKQKVGLMQVQKQAGVLGVPKVSTDNTTKAISTSPGPVVAKVLTNAAGQVISVESLLAHQKQHGTLPQGTTLRVQSTKGGPQNIIQLTNSATPKSSALAQFTVGTQNNILTLTTQPKLVASQTAAVTSTSTAVKPKAVSKSQQFSKFPPKVAQQLINARILSPATDGQKLVHSKVVVGQQGTTVKLPVKNSNKSVALNVGTGTNAIRMVNATNLNLTTIGGKPVLLASKGGAIQNLQGQNVILQTQSNSGPSLVLQNSAKLPVTSTTAQSQNNNINILNPQGNIVFSPQIKTQVPAQQVVFASSKNSMAQGHSQGQVVLGGQPLRLSTSNASNTQRVVLASQGQGGQIVAQQILLPAGFQGTAINIKALQGVKVIPIAQSQAKGGQTRQVFARVMSPNLVKQSTTTSQTNKVQDNASLSTSGSEIE